MARHSGPVLVDTNVILECHRTGSWRALSSGYDVETVEDCVTETQTGFQRRRPETHINESALRTSLKAIHAVVDAQRVVVAAQAVGIALDAGELDLWAHALARHDSWVLCGPDFASMRFGVRLGLKDRLIALETLLAAVGYSTSSKLRDAYTSKWLDRVLGELFIAEGFPRR